MPKPLVLLIDDSANDRELAAHGLREVLPDFARLEPNTQAEFAAALNGPAPVLAITDYQFFWSDGLRVLRAIKLRWPDCPVIMFTGTGDEIIAVEAMKLGLDDYVLKSEKHRVRLAPAVRAALEKAEQRRRLREAEQARAHLLAILEATPDFVGTATKEGRLLYLNRAGREMLGLAPDEDVTATQIQDYHPDGLRAQMEQELFPSVMAGGVWRGVNVLQTRDGRRLPVSQVVLAHQGAGGEIEFLSMVMRDISHLKRTEDALRENRQRLEGIISSAMDAIITINEEQRIVIFNAAAAQIFRCPAAEAIGSPLERFIPHRFQSAYAQHIRDFAASGVTNRQAGQTREFIGLRADGGEFPFEASLSQAEVGGQFFFTAILHDVSGRRALEDQLRQAQKMETVGTLASGVAHDFNNVLGVILGYSQLLLAESKIDEPTRKMVQAVNDAGRRGANLTRQLLTFSRRHTAHLQAEDLNRCVENLAKMLQRLIGEDIAFVLQLQPGLPPIHADVNMVDQVIMNLVINARDAMPHSGRLEISTGLVEAGANGELPPGAAPGAYAILRVRDTGQGILPEIMQRLFEPFFTTKPEGKGTGLGLSTVHTIMQQHKGWIVASSRVGEGTEFRAGFPLAAAVATPRPQTAPGFPLPRGRESILIVEDDVSMRTMIAEALSLFGYRVHVADSAIAATKLWEEHGAEMDLLFTDVVMPEGVSGFELAGRLTQEKSRLKVVFMSGYTVQSAPAGFELKPGINFLTKPFTLTELFATIRRNLDGQ